MFLINPWNQNKYYKKGQIAAGDYKITTDVWNF